MPKITFYPLGNADSYRIDLDNDKKLLFDYADCRCPDDPTDKRCDLASELKTDLGKRDYYDVVAFTHLDDDHIHGSSEFFWFEHAAKYQGDGRIKINEMWVPAAAITEEGCEDEAKVVRAEARYRLKQKKGIRVFSRPKRLEGWLKKNGMTLDEVAHLVTDAGKFVPDWDKNLDSVEFFVHSPFARRLNKDKVEDRNQNSLVLQATFSVSGVETRAILAGDPRWDNWNDIVDITREHEREEHLEWDIMKVAHHCSYLALDSEKGEHKTKPTDQVAWLYETQSYPGAVIVSTSKPIPQKNTEADEDVQPPHRQAANYSRSVIDSDEIDGDFVVTMEHPNISAPKPVVVTIGSDGAKLSKTVAVGSAAVVSKPASRVG